MFGLKENERKKRNIKEKEKNIYIFFIWYRKKQKKKF